MALRLLLPLLGAAALPGARSRLHSLRVLDTVVSEPGPGLPWFSRVVYVDDQVTFVYTSGMQRAKPRTAWMAENESPEFWDKRTWCAQRYQKWYNASLNTLGQLYNQSEVRPTARVSDRSSHDGLTTLSCKVSGFYPRDITVTWLRNGESRQQETYSEGILPSGDGTYQTWVTMEIDPKIKAHYSCHVEHEGLLEPLSVSWEPNNNLIPTVAGVITAVVLIGVIIGVVVWKKKRPGKKGDGYAVAQANDQGPSGSDLSAKGVKDSSERDFSVAADTAWAELSFCNDNSSGFREQSPVNCREEAAGTGPSTWGSRNPGL
ncbi:DLA class I histocompatibility antigen, A9/A9 alpha chain-like isoform X8 [Chelonia mydas]|uniref:DLA class I histocompatibility antigen, A9/A9 alpha chain-like isoform X8 n=1 Tax=Chelonia mydas TaxID=8469 RepID=UPI001CA9764F|nr:DLA class I histocompatibility antigen, A9/A9 alpha chain-like isoform X8 [Chelonia mydas]